MGTYSLKPVPSYSRSVSIPSPIGGLNARDSLANMDPLDAVSMTNFFPYTTDVGLRYGYSQHATGLPGQVETLMTYAGGSQNNLFAVSLGNIYDISSAGAVGAAGFTGLSNSRLQYINVSTAAGNYIRAVNGADKSVVYDGSSWHQDGDGAPYDISGVDSATLVGITLFKERIWFTQNATLSAWYLDTSLLGGAAHEFPLQAVAKMGGSLEAVLTWTLDAGQGVDDYLVFVTTKGEAIVYQGTDPTDITKFSLKGVWQLGSPVGRRCLNRLGGDILMICQDGLLPFSGALQSSRVNPRVALTDKIQQAVSEAISIYGGNFGWQTLYYPKNNMLFLNVPYAVGQQQQFVMNTITKSWCSFTGWNANCWELFNDDPYFGSDGFVGKAWDTLADNGTQINGDVKQAFNYLKQPGLNKRFTLMRPNLRSDGQPSYLAGVNVDFQDYPVTGLPNFNPISYATWDSGRWDISVWGGDLSVIQNWQGINGIGYCVAPRLTLASSGIRTNWMSSDLVFERGAIL